MVELGFSYGPLLIPLDVSLIPVTSTLRYHNLALEGDTFIPPPGILSLDSILLIFIFILSFPEHHQRTLLNHHLAHLPPTTSLYT